MRQLLAVVLIYCPHMLGISWNHSLLPGDNGEYLGKLRVVEGECIIEEFLDFEGIDSSNCDIFVYH